MSSSDGTNGADGERGGGSSPPVVQTILDSLTRCFHPDASSVVGACGRIDPCSGGGDGSRPATPVGDDGGDDNDVSAILSRAKLEAGGLPRDRDGGASTPRAGNTASGSTVAETIRARSMKRKLEIFRTDDAAGTGWRADGGGETRRAAGGRPPSDVGAPIRDASTANDLVLSDDEEELVQMSRKRFACGVGGCGADGGCIQLSTPVDAAGGGDGGAAAAAGGTSPGRPRNSWQWAGVLLSGAQRGLCFATPVRTASPENVERLPDDTLTDDEYAERYGGTEAVLATPEALETSYNEDETITSTLYFDHRFSHLPQNRPPMPLFTEDKLSLSPGGGADGKSDAITRMMRNRSLGDHRGFRETCSSPPRELDVRRRVPSSPTKLVRTPPNAKSSKELYADTPETNPLSPLSPQCSSASSGTPASVDHGGVWPGTPGATAGPPAHPNAAAAALVSPVMPRPSAAPVRLAPSKARMAAFPVPKGVPGGDGGVDDMDMDSGGLCEF